MNKALEELLQVKQLFTNRNFYLELYAYINSLIEIQEEEVKAWQLVLERIIKEKKLDNSVSQPYPPLIHGPYLWDSTLSPTIIVDDFLAQSHQISFIFSSLGTGEDGWITTFPLSTLMNKAAFQTHINLELENQMKRILLFMEQAQEDEDKERALYLTLKAKYEKL